MTDVAASRGSVSRYGGEARDPPASMTRAPPWAREKGAAVPPERPPEKGVQNDEGPASDLAESLNRAEVDARSASSCSHRAPEASTVQKIREHLVTVKFVNLVVNSTRLVLAFFDWHGK